jgi:hypothetical protein
MAPGEAHIHGNESVEQPERRDEAQILSLYSFSTIAASSGPFQ